MALCIPLYIITLSNALLSQCAAILLDLLDKEKKEQTTLSKFVVDISLKQPTWEALTRSGGGKGGKKKKKKGKKKKSDIRLKQNVQAVPGDEVVSFLVRHYVMGYDIMLYS